ncbi:MAG: nucleotidyltransferase domain-containing protein [Cyclobacteriaceae bacterium]
MPTEILQHHQKAIDNLTEEYQSDPKYLALIIGGSVAKQCARPDSDVDFMIVATEDEYARRIAVGDLFINRTDLCDYVGGYVDGKVINMQYLSDVAEKGNEPSRAAFDGAFLAYSRVDQLESLLDKIAHYPESGHNERIKSFYAMAFIQNWLMGEANRHDNVYTKARAASQLALFASRLILAHNRVLYPYHKWMLHYLEKCERKPKDFLKNIEVLLKEPNSKNANKLFQSIQEFENWGVTDHQAYMWFMEKVEWRWMSETTSLEDL